MLTATPKVCPKVWKKAKFVTAFESFPSSAPDSTHRVDAVERLGYSIPRPAPETMAIHNQVTVFVLGVKMIMSAIPITTRNQPNQATGRKKVVLSIIKKAMRAKIAIGMVQAIKHAPVSTRLRDGLAMLKYKGCEFVSQNSMRIKNLASVTHQKVQCRDRDHAMHNSPEVGGEICEG